MANTEGALPAGFEALEPLVAGWIRETQYERRERRATASMDELRAYHALVGPRIPDIARHLDRFAVDAPLAGPEQRLYRLGQMYMEVAWAVEFLDAPEEAGQVPRERWQILPIGGVEEGR